MDLDELVGEAVAAHGRYLDGVFTPMPFMELEEREELWRPLAEAAAADALNKLSAALALVGSPIEERFLAAFLMPEEWGWCGLRILDGDDCVAEFCDPTSPDWFEVRPQFQVGKYKADFHITHCCPGWAVAKQSVCVELDGHEFHQKTKKQAEHDKKRDRFFASQGLTVLRFTGSEVFRDASKCVKEVTGQLTSMVSAAIKARGA